MQDRCGHRRGHREAEDDPGISALLAGDDVIGFDHDGPLTGAFRPPEANPGKATTPEQLMADIDEVLKVTPGMQEAEPARKLCDL
mgnify:CR=1 FL=1